MMERDGGKTLLDRWAEKLPPVTREEGIAEVRMALGMGTPADVAVVNHRRQQLEALPNWQQLRMEHETILDRMAAADARLPIALANRT